MGKARKRNLRRRASDIFRDVGRVFYQDVGFEEAFPEIEDLKIVVEQDSHDEIEGIRVRHYARGLGEYAGCSNPQCYNGGLFLGSNLLEMVRNRETHKEESKICPGYEASPKGKSRYPRDCMNSFRITVDIKYKDGGGSTNHDAQ